MNHYLLKGERGEIYFSLVEAKMETGLHFK